MAETKLADRHCVPCRGGTPRLAGEDLRRLAPQVPDWRIVDQHHLTRTFLFPDFKTALGFVNRVGAEAEQEGHHPDVYLTWGKVEIKTWTHAIDGLSESDLILAAKIDRLAESRQ